MKTNIKDKLKEVIDSLDESKLEKILLELSPDFKKNYNFKDIKTFEDACEVLDIDPKSILDSVLSEDTLAYEKLKILTKAINDNWIPNWNDENQKKWYPCFNTQSKGASGFGFSFSSFYAFWFTFVGSRLCFETEEKANYAGNQFIDIYGEYLL
jgi:hypothetical protein